MKHFSRDLYRALAPAIQQTGKPEVDARARKAVLAECEFVMRRMVNEPHFADPAGSLFRSVRVYFALHHQRAVRRTIDRYVEAFLEKVRYDPESVGAVARCEAYSSRGRPCRRPPIPGMAFCASHRDWAEEPEPAQAAA
jgi:hypothetical protein